jgi:hypothetical protein
MNLNQPTMTYIVIGVWLVIQHPTESILSNAKLCCRKGERGGRKCTVVVLHFILFHDAFSVARVASMIW